MPEHAASNVFSFQGLKHPLPPFPSFNYEVQGLISHYGNSNYQAGSSYDISTGYDGRVKYGDRYKIAEVGLGKFSIEAVYRAMGQPKQDYAALHVYTAEGQAITRRRTYTQRDDFGVVLLDKQTFQSTEHVRPERLSDERTKRLLDFMHELTQRRPDEVLLQLLED
jgi:hypothetical protein